MQANSSQSLSIGKKIQKLRDKLKLKLFTLVFEMHSIVHLSSTVAGIMLAIDFMSIVVLIVYLRILSLPNTQSLFLVDLNLVYFANVTLFINEVNYALNSFFVFGFFYFIMVLLFTNPNKQRGRSEGWKLNFMIITLYSIHTCFSTLIIATQCVNIYCSADVQNFSCLEGENIITAIISAIGIIPCLLNSYFIENIYNFQFMGINGETGILSNQRSFTLIGPLSKYFCLSIYYSGLPNSVTSIMFICVSIVYLIQLYVRFKLSYNFSKFLSEIEVTGMAICVYNFAMCVVVNTLDFEATNGDFFISFIFNFVLAYLIYLLKKSSWNNKLDDNFLSLKSIPQKEIYAYRMLECIMNFSFTDQLLLSGLLKTHKKQCNHKKCLCSFEKLMKEIKDEEHKRLILDFKIMKAGMDDQEGLLNKEKKIVQQGSKTCDYQGSLQKIKNSQQLQYLHILLKWLDISYVDSQQQRMRIIQAFIQTEFLDKDLQSLFLLSSLKHKKMNLKEQFAIFCYQRIIFEKVNERIKNLNNQSLDISQIQKSIQTEKKLTKLYQNIELVVNDCQKFWKIVLVQEKGLDFIKLYKLSLEISQSALRADKLYQEIRRIQPSFFNIIVIYCKFQKHVLNYESDSQKEKNELAIAIQKRGILRAQSIDFSNELQDLNKKIGMIVLKASEKSLGKISLVNTEIANITQQPMDRLLNANLSIIFPSVIDESSHNKCLEAFYTERTQSTFINQKQNLWIKDIDGFLILVDFYVQPFFDQILGLQLISYLKVTEKMKINDNQVLSQDLYTIITDQYGKIQTASQNFSKILQCSNSEDLMNSDINIFTLCPALNGIIQTDSIHEGDLAELVLTELNLEISEYRKLHSSIQRQTMMMTEMQSLKIENFGGDYFKDLTFNHSENQSQILSRRNSTQIRIKGDVRFMDGNHRYFCFGVFYFSFVTNEKLITKNPEEMMSEGIASQNGESIDQGSVTASSASSSDGKRAKRIDNLKSEYEIMKAPRIIGLFQKIFMIYFAIFLGLAIGLMVTSTQFVGQIFEDLKQLETSKRAFDQLIEMRKNFREVILLSNNQTIFTSALVKNRSEVFIYNTQQQLNTLKDLSNLISTYILDNVDDSRNDYAKSLQNDELQLQVLYSTGSVATTSQKFPSALQMLIQQVQVMLSLQNKTCNCLFRPTDFSGNYTYSDFERNFYFVDKNSVDVIGKFLYSQLANLEAFIHESSENSQSIILYLSVPGVFVSILCTVIFFPVLMMMTNNRKAVIQMLAKLKIRTSRVQLRKLDRFLGELQSNKQKREESAIIQINDQEYDQMQEESLQKSTLYLEETSSKQDGQNLSISASVVQGPLFFLRPENFESRTEEFEQSLTEKQLISIKEKSTKIAKAENIDGKTQKTEKNQETFSDIERQFKRKNCFHFFNLLLLAAIYSSFFAMMYYFNTRVSQDINLAVKVISVFEDRSACISAIPLYVRERIIQNSSVQIGFLDNKPIDSLFEKCLLNANQILEYRKDVPSCLRSSQDLVNTYEGFKLCERSDYLYQSNSFLRQQYKFDCQEAANGIFQAGISQSYSYLLAEFRKYQISFEGLQPTASNLMNALKDIRFVSFQGTITYFLKPVIAELNIKIYQEAKDYLQFANNTAMIVFVIFILILFSLIIIILVFLVKVVQRQLYFNKKVIKFMPMIELQRKTMQKLLKKLNI